MSEPVRRLELFTGAGRRRTWSEDEKVGIVAESDRPGTSISAVARRHGLCPSQLFTWRRLARQARRDDRQTELRFVPAMVEPEALRLAHVPASIQPGQRSAVSGIEIAIAGATVRVGPDASEAQIAAVIRALRALA